MPNVNLSYKIQFEQLKTYLSHLEEIKESNQRCFTNMLLTVSEEEPSCDACV